MNILARFRTPPAKRILEEMLGELRELNRSNRHIYGLQNALTPFVAKFPNLRRTGESEIAAYLRDLALRVGERRCENILGAILQLSHFAKRRNYLPEDRLSAGERVRKNWRRRWITDADPIATWTLAEARLLLEATANVSPRWLPATALGLFAGLRTSEILRLDWGAVKFDQQIIAISSRVARKTRTSRLIPIQDNLLAWLRPFHGLVGPIYPGHFKSNENKRSIQMALVRSQIDLPRKHNANRHSFGSYRLAVLKSYEQVAQEMGNSPQKVRENYNDPKTQAEGTAYFQIAPADSPKIIALADERSIKPLTGGS